MITVTLWDFPIKVLWRYYYIRKIMLRNKLRKRGDSIAYIAIDSKKIPFHIRQDDFGLSLDILFYGQREPFATDIFLQKKANMFVDIGANLGYYSVLAAEFGVAKKIVAVEPLPENFSVLQKNLRRYSNVMLVNCAVGDKNARVQMSSPKSSNSARIRNTNGSIPMKKLSEIIGDDASNAFIKMDVEGFEYNIILGNIDFFKRSLPDMFVEIHPDILGKKRTEHLLNTLDNLGYYVEAVIKEVPVYWYTLKCMYATSLDKYIARVLGVLLLQKARLKKFGVLLRDVPMKKLLSKPYLISGHAGALELFVRG